MFLDEPTSGLDSHTSCSILNLLKKLTKAGQAILCTIHQPSTILFQRFDRLLLLAAGSETDSIEKGSSTPGRSTAEEDGSTPRSPLDISESEKAPAMYEPIKTQADEPSSQTTTSKKKGGNASGAATSSDRPGLERFVTASEFFFNQSNVRVDAVV